MGIFALAMTGTANAAQWANPELLLSAKQVKAQLNSADWLIVDCRDLDDYAIGHIPGAISFGKRCKKALRDKTSRVFRDSTKYEKLLGKVGIGNDTHVVLYGEHIATDTVRDSAIAFWILEYLGHDKVHVLNKTSAFIWGCLGDELDEEAIRQRLEKTFDLSAVKDVPEVSDPT